MELRAEGEGDKMVVVSAKTSGYIGGAFRARSAPYLPSECLHLSVGVIACFQYQEVFYSFLTWS
jgi:hypothetical protein